MIQYVCFSLKIEKIFHNKKQKIITSGNFSRLQSLIIGMEMKTILPVQKLPLNHGKLAAELYSDLLKGDEL